MRADGSMTRQWLLDPERAGLRAQDLPAGEAISPPVRQADRAREVPSVDNGEPLVPVDGELPIYRVYQELRFRTVPREVRLREGLVERLVAARESLPAPFSLVVIDGWRSMAFQRELLDYYSRRHATVDGYVSDPGDEHLVPPHVTGGAVDLTLTHDGRPLGLGTDFDAFEDKAAVGWFEIPGRTGEPGAELARRLRRYLASALLAQGLAPLAEEWWHWSLGDQRWADHHGETQTRYGLVPD
jgi:D-alanyl-D-alanine dipeptidase